MDLEEGTSVPINTSLRRDLWGGGDYLIMDLIPVVLLEKLGTGHAEVRA